MLLIRSLYPPQIRIREMLDFTFIWKYFVAPSTSILLFSAYELQIILSSCMLKFKQDIIPLLKS